MPVMLERWNDDKMDALAGDVTDVGRRVDILDVKVDGLGEQVDKRFEQVDEDLREQRQDTRELRQEMKVGFEKLSDQFRRMQWALVGVAGAIISALIGAPHL
jgi:peptidoglycan hydrolase CwlO-like protein